jgi:chaperonin cofactor prefoldin
MTSDFSAPPELASDSLEIPVTSSPETPDSSLEDLLQRKQTLLAEIADLQSQKQDLQSAQLQTFQSQLQSFLDAGTQELEQRRQTLEKEIERLERRQERIQQEMRTTFAGASQELAIRLQGFKEYLVGSLQDLASAADQLDWETAPAPIVMPEMGQERSVPKAGFVSAAFGEQKRQILALLEQYRTRPDYYGPPWQLRRTFEPIHAERVQDWFLSQGGRGAIKSLGSRLQNILVGSAVISILSDLYGDRARALILANTPERLGEWRRGLQDCLGISRSDFGPERGVALFESPDALIQRAERLEDDEQVPLILIDEAEEQVDLGLLRFPLWLAFAPESPASSGYFY